jgi:hypothetical protein
MTKKFNFIELDKSKLPVTKGKKVDGFRFYDIEGKAYPSITTKKAYKNGETVLVKKLPTGK